MATTKDIKDFTKYPSLSDNDYLLGTKTDLGGTDAGITVSDFRKLVIQDVKPEIKDGYWWVNGVNTGVKAEGQIPVFRYTDWGLEYKLAEQDDAAFQKLVPFSDIAFTWDDLTEEQREGLKGERGLSAYQVWLSVEGNGEKTLEEYLLWLRQPASEAATELRDRMIQISEEANMAIEAANAAKEAANTAAENVHDGKTPVLESVNAESGETPSGSFAENGVDGSGNPKYILNLTLPKGDNGRPPLFEQGSTVTGEPETEASVEVVANGFTPEGNPKYILNFIIPRGKQGIAGTGSGNVCADATGLIAGKQYVFVPDVNDSTTGTFVAYTVPELDTTDLVKINDAALPGTFANELGYGNQADGWKKTGPVLQFGGNGAFKQILGDANSDDLYYRSKVGDNLTGYQKFAFAKSEYKLNGKDFEQFIIDLPHMTDSESISNAVSTLLGGVEGYNALSNAVKSGCRIVLDFTDIQVEVNPDFLNYEIKANYSETTVGDITLQVIAFNLDHMLRSFYVTEPNIQVAAMGILAFLLDPSTSKFEVSEGYQRIDLKTIANVATADKDGLMSSKDKKKIDRQESTSNAVTVANLDVDYRYIYVMLNANASLSASAAGSEYNGRSITAFVYSQADYTIAIPTTGSYVSMCGSSYTCTAGKWVEFNLTCLGGKWHIAKLEQE